MRNGLLGAILLAFGLGYLKMAQQPEWALFQPPAINASHTVKPAFHSGFVSTGQTRLVHAPSMVELGNGRIMAFWFAGSREGSADVVIRSAVYDPGRMNWGDATTVASRWSTQAEVKRYVRKLGNPVAIRDAAGTVWLFYVSAVAGWSFSAINLMTSTDDGESWSQARRLVTSPFLNLSTLVKTNPFFFQDGSIGLPVYHELIGKFGELLRLDGNARIVFKQRLSHGRGTLQPLVLIENERNALALMRYSGAKPRRARQVMSRDAGQKWSAPEPSILPNPDSAIAGLVLSDGSALVVLNHNEAMRDELSLVWSGNQGHSWKMLFRFEDERQWRGASFSAEQFATQTIRLARKTDARIENTRRYVEAVRDTMCHGQPCRFQFDYPYLIQAADGSFHLLYTWNRSYIKHVQFNRAWLEARRLEAK